MSYQRHQRIESLIERELNNLFLKELEFSGAIVTITGVEVQKDLDYALVKVSVLPVTKSKEVSQVLERSRKYLQHQLLRKINIKPMPELRFEIDYGPKRAADLEKKFIELEKEEGSL